MYMYKCMSLHTLMQKCLCTHMYICADGVEEEGKLVISREKVVFNKHQSHPNKVYHQSVDTKHKYECDGVLHLSYTLEFAADSKIISYCMWDEV